MKNKLIELIDFEKVNELLDGFYKTTGFVTAILDLEGNVLSKSGWRQICTDFHRVHPETAKKCTISDTVLAGKLAQGEKYHFYKCLNGLVDVAVPIIIKGEHIANLFSGQFFFEEPDKTFFQEQAAKYKFNPDIYLKALGDVPVVSKEKVKSVMDFLLNMTQLISEMTFQKLEQKVLNNTLQESEGRYRAFVSASYDSVYRMSPDWKIMYTLDGRGFIADTEKPNATWFQEYIPPDDQKQVMAVIQQAIRTKSIFELEHHVWRVDGTIGWTSSRAIPRLDAHGEIFEWLGAASDITERKMAEEQLRLSEVNLAEAQRIAHIGSWDWDMISNTTRWSDELYRVFDIDPNTNDGRPDFFIPKVHPDDVEIVANSMKSLSSSGKLPTIEYRVIYRDGSIHNISAEGWLEIDEAGNPIRNIGTAQDITERKQAEEALAKIDTKYLSLFDSIRDAIMVADTERKIIEINPAFTSTFGYTPEEVLGKQTLYVYEKEAQFIELGNAIKAHANDNTPFLYTVNYRKKSGEVFPGETGVYFLKDTNGVVTGFIGLIRDVTERKKADEELKSSENKFAILFGQASLPAILTKIPGNEFVDVNNAWLQLFGYTKEDVIGKTSLEIGLNRNVQLRSQTIDTLTKNREIRNLEQTLYSKSSEAITVLTNVNFVEINGEEFALTSMQDISESKKTELELRESEKRHRMLFENTLDGMAYHRIIFENGKAVDYVYLQVNEAFARQTGLKDVIGKKASELVPGLHKTNPELLERYVKVAKTGIPIQYETYVEQRKTWFFTSLYALSEDIVVSVFKNITERKLAELSIKESEERYRSVYENSSVAILLSSADGSILSANDFACRIFNRTEKEICEAGSDGLIDLTDPNLPVMFEHQTKAGRANGELTFLKKDGTKFPCEVSSVIFNDKEGNKRTSMVIRDLTEQKQKEEEIKKLNEELEQKVKERTNELETKYEELNQMNKLFVNRELRMIELKEKIKNLEEKLKGNFN